MLVISDKQLTPPKGWAFLVPETGEKVVAASYSALFARAIRSLQDNNLDIPLDYEQIFNDQLCHQNIHAQCEAIAPITNETRKLNAGDAIRFVKTLSKWLSSGAEIVPQEEADRRSEICVGCPYNVAITGCSVCQGLASKIYEVIGRRTSRFDKQLKGCAVCGCVNRAQVHVPLSVLKKGVTPEMDFPAWCWKRQELLPK